jgi:hypothetical protein
VITRTGDARLNGSIRQRHVAREVRGELGDGEDEDEVKEQF